MKHDNYQHNKHPYGPDWPDHNYHPDWPHYNCHPWNDTEHAMSAPYHDDCYTHPYDEYVGVTTGDVIMWNTISALSGLSGLNISDLSGLSALSAIAHLIPVAEEVVEMSGTWSSAEYVPDIMENLSAMSAKIDTKAPLSAEYLNQVYSDPEFFTGLGTKKSVLRPTQDLKDTVDMVYASTQGFTKKLVNTDECDIVEKNINALNDKINEQKSEISRLEKIVSGISGNNILVHKRVTLEESKKKPNILYYFDSMVN